MADILYQITVPREEDWNSEQVVYTRHEVGSSTARQQSFAPNSCESSDSAEEQITNA